LSLTRRCALGSVPSQPAYSLRSAISGCASAHGRRSSAARSIYWHFERSGCICLPRSTNKYPNRPEQGGFCV